MTGRERFLAACAGRPTDTTPAWFLRQAGGALPRYQALRSRHAVMDIARTPALCAEVSVEAARTLGADGAVLFADIMLLVEAMGVPVELTGSGPRIDRPVRDGADVAALRTVDPATDLGFVLEAIGLVGSAVDAAVVGIAGGPFTLAAYLIEGAPTRDQVGARALALREPATWFALLDRLADATIAYIAAQAAAGADVVQLFDTWAGTLTADEYRHLVAPATRRILAAAPLPTILSVARAGPILDEVAACGSTVVHVDSRQSLAAARERLGPDRPLQGNLDPAAVAAGSNVAMAAARTVVRDGGRTGHLFNLGEPAPRDTPVDLLRDLVAFVHDTGVRP